jgi:hypothetical protein
MKILFIPIFLLVYSLVPAQNYHFSGNQWDPIDLKFRYNKKVKNPFDVDFGCILTGPDGKSLKVPGFFNGNSEWIVRFCPESTGKWEFTTWSSQPGLAGNTGQVEVKDPADNNHGPLMINPDDPRYLAYSDGTPYFLMAFEADWLFALDYGQQDLTKTSSLSSTIRDHGFNQVVMNVYAYDVSWQKDEDLQDQHEYGALEDIYPFGGSNSSPVHTTMNLDFFKHLDRVIEELGKNGIIAHLMIYVWNKEVNWPEAYSPEDNRYFDYIIKRYQGYPNLLWDVSKEALGYGHDDMDYISDRIRRIRILDAHERLITVHDYAYCSTHPELVDIISTQDWSTDLYHRMLQVRENHEGKPVFNIEHGGYEQCQYDVFTGDYDDAEVCLERNYLCAFAGVYSTYYWQCTSWNVVIHDMFDADVDPKPKLGYYKNFASFFQKHPFHTFKPVAGGASSGFGLYDQQDTHIYYIPDGNIAIHLQMEGDPSDVLEIIWFNPVTGEYRKKEDKSWSAWLELVPEFPDTFNIVVVNRK